MKRTPYLTLCLICTLSCTKYLDIKPYGQTIPKTAEEFSAILHSHLQNIDEGEKYIIGNVESVCDFECYADNLEANLTRYPDGNYIPLYVGDDINSQNYHYSSLYAIIRDCNIITENLTDTESRLAKDVLGTAYALRGVCYYNLLRNFCEPAVNNPNGYGVPLITQFDMEEKAIRSTIQKTVEQVESDFVKALSYNIEDEVFRFNNDVINGYLARINFWAGDWSDAAEYAKDVLEAYPLISGPAYTEMILSEETRKGNILIKGGTILDGNLRSLYESVKKSTNSRPVSKNFIALFDNDKDKDIRYNLFISPMRTFVKSVLSCLRSAEMQLVLAESLYHSGDETGALAALNELKRNRISGYTDLSMESLPAVNEDDIIKQDAKGNPLTPLIYAILCERRKELFMEGDRWYELKRNGRPEFWAAKQGRKYTTMQFMYTFPIPINDIYLVEGMIQNPGYDKTR